MKQINIYPVIVKSKALNDGSHRVRIAVSFHNQTKYIVTRFTIPSVKNFRNGEVTGTPTDVSTNRKLRELVNTYYNIYDSIPNAEALTTSQIVNIIKDGGLETITLKKAGESFHDSKRCKNVKDATFRIFDLLLTTACDFFGEDFPLENINPVQVTKYALHLKKRGLSDATIRMRMNYLRSVITFSVRRGFVSYKVHPFVDYRVPAPTSRDVALTVEQLRKFRDLPLTRRNQIAIKNYFFFSFYTCGMNLCDMLDLDITKDVVSFRRHKTENRRKKEDVTEFTMQPEAKEIAKMSLRKDRIVFLKDMKKNPNIQRRFFYAMETIRKTYLPECKRLIMYSARKTFAQLAAELGYSDNVIEYCIGDSESKKSAITYYRKTSRAMADRAIRDVFDFVASDKNIEEWLDGRYHTK